jgi:hypothetical protein
VGLIVRSLCRSGLRGTPEGWAFGQVTAGRTAGILCSVRRWPLLIIVFLVVAQGLAAVPPVLTPPAGSLPEMQSRARALGPAVLVAEAIGHGGLRSVLDRGGYVAGSEREFFGRTPVFSHVTEQVLRFESGAGATSYLRWLRAHTAESLGAPRSVTAAGLGTGGFVYRPKGCGCHSDTPTYLIAWRRGNLVLTVLASGNGATAKTAGALSRRLDHAAS